MATPSGSESMFGLGLQANSALCPYGWNNVQATEANFHWFPFTELGHGAQQTGATLPIEAGRSVMTRGYYKSGALGSGGFGFVPRTDGEFGWLLLGALGNSHRHAGCRITALPATAGTTDADLTTIAGVDVLEFTFPPVETVLPYFTSYRIQPHATAAMAEIIADNRVSTLGLTLPATGALTGTTQMQGRTIAFAANPFDSTWVAPTYDNDDTFVAGPTENSGVLIRKDLTHQYLLKAVSLQFTVNNGLLAPDSTRYIGSLYHIDHPVTSRAATFTVTVLVEDWGLYRELFGNTDDAVALSAVPLKGSLDFRAFSPLQIGSTSQYYGIQIKSRSTNVVWGTANVIAAEPNRPLIVQLTGTVVRTSAGSPFKVRLQGDPNATFFKTPSGFKVDLQDMLFPGGIVTALVPRATNAADGAVFYNSVGYLPGEYVATTTNVYVTATNGTTGYQFLDNGVALSQPVLTNAILPLTALAADHHITVGVAA